MNNIVILSEWNNLSILAGAILSIGIFITGIFAAAAFIFGKDVGENWLCVFVCLAVTGIGMIILSTFLPRDHGYKIMLNDNVKFSEVVERYNIIETDGLILKVTEKTEDVVNGPHN